MNICGNCYHGRRYFQNGKWGIDCLYIGKHQDQNDTCNKWAGQDPTIDDLSYILRGRDD